MIRILSRTAGYVLCVKPRGVASEAGPGGMPALIGAALGIPEEQALAVHRLDRETGGVMIYALNRKTAASLSALIAEGKMEKTYLAVTEGQPAEPAGQWTDLLYWDRSKRKSYPVRRPRGGVKEARLSYQVLRTAGSRALLRVSPQTGRTHQIRVQCASRGLPLWGDGRYGGKEKNGFGLWCQRLTLPDPEQPGRMISAAADPPDEAPWNTFLDDRSFALLIPL